MVIYNGKNSRNKSLWKDEPTHSGSVIFFGDKNQLQLRGRLGGRTNCSCARRLGGRTVYFLIDTGANVSVVSMDIVQACGLSSSVDTEESLVILGDDGQRTPQVLGVLKAFVYCQGVELRPYFAVVDQNLQCILGMDVIRPYCSCLVLSPERPLMQLKTPTSALKSMMSPSLRVECVVNGRMTEALVDTGANCSFISLDLVHELGLQFEESSLQGFQTIKGISPMFGIVRCVTVALLGQVFTLEMKVEHSKDKITVGLDALLGFTLCFDEDADRLIDSSSSVSF
ncbi:uncharacterized protein LOC135199603 [Macrobrachium nipponense]|uniref:uncharacterized protein LOC135199603 n=1 Tax=Macrobrachium nipponense TaxID=159736 RepID=UPI0030C810BA